MKLPIKKLHQDATIPQYAHNTDAGMDLYAINDTTIESQQRVQVPIGIAMEIPEGYVGLIWDKSGISHKGGLKTLGGVIDSGYRGEIMIGMINLSNEAYVFKKGYKIAQMLIQKVEQLEVVEVKELESSDRGEGAFGSTGK